jgi:Pyridoxamine 5'-phosphate oxidase
MSKVVEIADLEEALRDYSAGYLLTWSADGRVKVVSIAPSYHAARFVLTSPGRGSCANAAANSTVTLLFAPLQQPGFSLIVDGSASVVGDDVIVSPTSAILHRPAA